MTEPAIGGTLTPRGNAADVFSAAERAEIAQVKRFIERYTADSKFRSALAETRNWFTDKSALDVAREAGLAIDPKIVAPLWCGDRQNPLDEADYPTLELCRRFKRISGSSTESRRALGDTAGQSSVFTGWRRRQIHRTESELGKQATRRNPFPVVSFELTDGCSVGCWFCGFSAKKYESSFRYNPENAGLWREVLQVLVDEFGDAARLGVCYWATDPLDNPDYERFADDYRDITGSLPSVTTALAVKDIERTRNLLKTRREQGGGLDRFSILTVKMLDQVHRAFTAEELLYTELVPQTRGSLYYKKAAGRLHKPRKSGPSGPDVSAIKAGSIACGAGYLINMVQRRAQLISPCQTSDRWPLGYVVHAEGHFDTAEEFRDLIFSIRDNVMAADLQPESLLRLHDNVSVETTGSGFALKSPCAAHPVERDASFSHLAQLLNDGSHRFAEVTEQMSLAGADPATIDQTIRDIFDHGFLCDDPVTLAGRSSDCSGYEIKPSKQDRQDSSDKFSAKRSSISQPRPPGAGQVY